MIASRGCYHQQLEDQCNVATPVQSVSCDFIPHPACTVHSLRTIGRFHIIHRRAASAGLAAAQTASIQVSIRLRLSVHYLGFGLSFRVRLDVITHITSPFPAPQVVAPSTQIGSHLPLRYTQVKSPQPCPHRISSRSTHAGRDLLTTRNLLC